MKLSFLHDLNLFEALEINPLEIEAFIKENNLEEIASVQNGILHIWRYRIPLNYKKGAALPVKHLNALNKFFKLIDSMSSKYYSGLFDISPEESTAIKNLIFKAIMPHDDARALAMSLTKRRDWRRNEFKKSSIRNTYNVYKKIDADTDIMQLPLNMALLLSAMMDLRSPKSHYDPLERFRWDDDLESEEAKTVQRKLDQLKELSSHTKRLELFRQAAWHLTERRKGYNYRNERFDPQSLDKRDLKTFIKLEDVPSAGWSILASVDAALGALPHLRELKQVQHMPSIPHSFWYSIENLKRDLKYRMHENRGITPEQIQKALEWWAKYPEAEYTVISDTITMAHRYDQPIKFWNRDLAALKAEHDELIELSHAEEKKQTFNNDILLSKTHGNLNLEYLSNTYDLKYEGKIMNHCVGSYSEDCTSGQSVIYRIHWKGKHVGTLELQAKEHGEVTVENATVRQAKGKFNRNLSQEINDAINALLITNKKMDKEQKRRLAKEKEAQKATQTRGKTKEEPQLEQDPGLWEDPCYECGGINVEEMHGGRHCWDCGFFEQDQLEAWRNMRREDEVEEDEDDLF